MKTALLLLASIGASAAPSIVRVSQPTQTTHAIGIRGYSGSCTIAVSTSPTFSPVIPDVDNSLHAGSNADTTRDNTYSWKDGTRIVTIGHNRGDRALATATTYYVQISGCGGTATDKFTTPTISSGTTQQWPVPFDATKPWNFDYPQVDLLNRGKTYVDPITGVQLTPINMATDTTWRTGTQPYQGPNCCAGTASPFLYVAGGSGWSNIATVSNGSPAGSTSTATTGNTNPLDVYGIYTHFLQTAADDPWGGITYDDLGAVMYGSASNGSGSNANVTICIFTDPGAGCLGTPITLTFPLTALAQIVSSSTDADKPWPNSFPSPYFSGWGLTAPLGPDHVNTQGLLNAVGGVLTNASTSNCGFLGPQCRFSHFPSTMVTGQKIFVAGSAAQGCINNLCTMATYQSINQITVVENVNLTNAAYTTLMWGLRIQKATATGTISVGAGFKNAGSRSVDQQGATGPLCNSNGFTSGDGHFGYLCTLYPTAFAGGMSMYFVSSDGTAREIYSGIQPPNSATSCFTPSNPNDAPNPSQFSGLLLLPDVSDAKTFYVWTGNGLGGGLHSLYKMVYSGDTTESLSLNYGLSQTGDGFIRNAPCDLWAWTNVMPVGHDLQTQVLTNYPSYNTSLYGNWNLIAQFDGIGGHFAYFDNNYGGQDKSPSWVMQVDLSTSPATITNLINTLDGTGTGNRVRWGGHHNTAFTTTSYGPGEHVLAGIAAMGNVNTSGTAVTWVGGAQFNNPGWAGGPITINSVVYTVASVTNPTNLVLTSSAGTQSGVLYTGPVLYSGPFKASVLGVMRSGVFSPTTNLPWPPDSSYDNTCPAGNIYAIGDRPPVGKNMDATGSNCVTLHLPAGGPCDVNALASEVVANPCPWNGVFAQPVTLAVGDVFTDFTQSDPFAGNSPTVTDGEHFRVISITTLGDGTLSVVVQRNAMRDYCCANPTFMDGINNCADGLGQFIHPNGWSIMMVASGFNSCSGGGATLVNGSPNIMECGRILCAGHGDQFPAPTPGSVSWVSGDSNLNTGVRFNQPAALLFTLPTTYFELQAPLFYNQALAIGNGVQSYPSSPGTDIWMTDFNSMNPNGGSGPELWYNSISGRSLTATATANVFKIQVVGTVNYKLFPLIGWAGRYLLHDISGPGSSVDASPYSECYVYVNGECHASSVVGEVYVNVPQAGGGALDLGTCIAGNSWLVAPCVISGYPGGGGARQTRYDVPDPNSGTSRLLGYMMTSPGEHYPFTGLISLPDGKAAIASPHQLQNWGPVSFLVTLPPWDINSVNRTTGVPIKVPVTDHATYAEVQFGYARYGLPSQFYCSPRAEACNTSSAPGVPFNYESSDTRTLTSCTSGCTITIPAVASNLVYYRIRTSSDGVTWVNKDVIPYAVP